MKKMRQSQSQKETKECFGVREEEKTRKSDASILHIHSLCICTAYLLVHVYIWYFTVGTHIRVWIFFVWRRSKYKLTRSIVCGIQLASWLPVDHVDEPDLVLESFNGLCRGLGHASESECLSTSIRGWYHSVQSSSSRNILMRRTGKILYNNRLKCFFNFEMHWKSLDFTENLDFV